MLFCLKMTNLVLSTLEVDHCERVNQKKNWKKKEIKHLKCQRALPPSHFKIGILQHLRWNSMNLFFMVLITFDTILLNYITFTKWKGQINILNQIVANYSKQTNTTMNMSQAAALFIYTPLDLLKLVSLDSIFNQQWLQNIQF